MILALRSPMAMARGKFPHDDHARRLYARGVRDSRRELVIVVNMLRVGEDVDANLKALRLALLGPDAEVPE